MEKHLRQFPFCFLKYVFMLKLFCVWAADSLKYVPVSTSSQNKLLSQSQSWQGAQCVLPRLASLEKKMSVLVRMVYHWAIGDSWSLAIRRSWDKYSISVVIYVLRTNRCRGYPSLSHLDGYVAFISSMITWVQILWNYKKRLLILWVLPG